MGKNRSKDFRYVFVNSFGVRLGDNDVTLTLGMTEGGDPEDMLEEVAVLLSPEPSTPVLGKEESPLVVLEPTLKLELLPMGKNRSKDFRYVFVNAFGVRLGDNDVTKT